MKTNMSGLQKDYTKVLKLVNEASEILYGSGHAIQDMMYFGWVGEAAANEREMHKNIDNKIKELKSYLEGVIGSTN